MSEFFGQNRVEYQEQETNRRQYHNMVNDPILDNYGRTSHVNRNFNNCCGFNAVGDNDVLYNPDLGKPVVDATPEPINTKVQNLQAINYAKTALALIGAYAVIKFIIGKFSKKAA